MTPQDRASCLQTRGLELQPMIGQPGLYLEIMDAVNPDIVTVMIALVVHVAWEIAVVISGSP